MRKASAPGKILRILFRLPLLLYRARLGWLLGSRFLMLTHAGRVSGLPRYTVLEVVHQDQIKGTFYVVAAYAEHADWLRNVMLDPRVTVTSGWRTFAAIASRLEHQNARKVLLWYALKHPRALRVIARLFQIDYDGTAESVSRMAQALPVVSLLTQRAEEGLELEKGAMNMQDGVDSGDG